MIPEETVKTIAKEIADLGKPTLLLGYPGLRKTRIARRVVDYLGPPKDIHLLSQIRQVYKAAGLQEPDTLTRPFRAPHHTVSSGALLGRRPDPDTAFPFYGEYSLAHGGVLLLDELPEFTRSVIDTLPEVLREKRVTHGTRTGNVYYPADFLLIGSMNPCPCGYQGSKDTKCDCSVAQTELYARRLGRLLGKLRIIDLREMENIECIY